MAHLQQWANNKNRPVDFYGKVIDQNSNGLPGVAVKVRVREWQVSPFGDVGGHMTQLENVTDVDGLFHLQGAQGDCFDVESIEKEGYSLSPKTYPSYGPADGTSDRPVVFKMWKTGNKEPLVSGQKVFGLIPDGRTYTLNLLEGKKMEGADQVGDLRIAIVRPNETKPGEKYPWSFKIEGIDGGLISSDDEFMYLAPESGYEPKFQIQFLAGDTNWTPVVKRRFFFRARNGQAFGRMEVEVSSEYNHKSAIEVNFAINPAGSRNLE